MGVITAKSNNIDSGVVCDSTGSCWLDSALALVPGLYVTVKWNWLKDSVHCDWHRFSLLALHRFSRFLWAVNMRSG